MSGNQLPSGEHAALQAETAALFPDARLTSPLFKLDTTAPDRFVRDIMLSEPCGSFDRLLVMDSAIVDYKMYDQLEAADIPQLPRLEADALGKTPEQLAVFGVYRGMQALRARTLPQGTVSHTLEQHVTDQEAALWAGRLSRYLLRTFQRLPLTKDQADTPFDHIGHLPFTAAFSGMVLCPPYGNLLRATGEFDAEGLFRSRIESYVARLHLPHELTKVAMMGFGGLHG
jgi:hypothetical protein